MDREWSTTHDMLKRLFTYMEKIKTLNERSERERNPLKLLNLEEDADGINLAIRVPYHIVKLT